MRVIATDAAPKAIGPYSQAIVNDNLVFTAGSIRKAAIWLVAAPRSRPSRSSRT